MIGIAILCFISGFLLGGSIGFILGHREGTRATVEHFEKKLAGKFLVPDPWRGE